MPIGWDRQSAKRLDPWVISLSPRLGLDEYRNGPAQTALSHYMGVIMVGAIVITIGVTAVLFRGLSTEPDQGDRRQFH